MTNMTDGYYDALIQRLTALKSAAEPAMKKAADAVVKSARSDGRIYIFGTGHSHMMAEEMHYRAGGLAITVPILAAPTMIHEGAVAGTRYERLEGVVAPIFDRYNIQPDDVLFVISNSGVNAAPIEAASIGKAIGCTVIGITSLDYSSATANGRQRLADIADIVIDNGAPPGDAVMTIPGTELKAGPVSTAIGMTILNAIFVEVASQLASDGDAPIYLSANMPGAKEINQKLVERYRPRNPHL
ncbi:SIS domain-containing protein [uncultured Cohaesibacter sp.]|uniref:SIS domain-containing protein n=1 Tax=uncultured Cohaesibacter sp. TaxID=1002546 RepID=UPI0029C90427|nr:SIS domain-containing protein [uncultured Cohaesibacter sp.]